MDGENSKPNQALKQAETSPKKSQKRNVDGYVISVSPMKTSKKNHKYFNVDLQTQNDVKTAICFSPTKRRLLEDASADHRGMEVRNVTVTDDNKVFISDHSTIHSKDLGFPYGEKSHVYDSLMTIINEKPVHSQVNVQGVLQLDPIRMITAQDQEIPIREGFIVDDEGTTMKITLWREYTELISGTTYDFVRLAKVKYGDDCVLQSIHQTAYKESEEQITDYDAPERAPNVTLENASVICVAGHDSLLCPTCKSPADTSKCVNKLFKCQSCHNTLLEKNLKKNPTRKISVTQCSQLLICHDTVLGASFPERNVGLMDSDQIMLLLLSHNFVITYDPATNGIVSMEPLPSE